jgi:site-specific recombinase XerD
MKNGLTPTQGTAAVSPPWRAALRMFDQDLRRRGAGERTRRAYGTDAAELAAWATANGLEPRAVDEKALRRWAARPADARRLAAVRGLFRSLLEHGEVPINPAEVIAAHEVDVTALLGRIPASTPLELRDRALFALAYVDHLGVEEIVGLDVADAERLASAPVRAYLERARPALAGADGDPALFLSKSGRRLSASDVRRRLRSWARHAGPQGHLASAVGLYTRVESARLRAAYAKSHPRA